MSISRRAKFIRWLTSRYLEKADVANAPVVTVRQRLDKLGGMLRPARGVAVEKAELAGLHTEWYRPPGASKERVMLYLHGGAYALGSCDSHRKLVTHIAQAGSINTVLPEYRLAPEHPFPAGLEDCVSAYRALLGMGYSANNILIGGDSAGGGLTVATTLQLRHTGIPLPRSVVLLSPFLDMSASGESMTTRADLDPWFDPADLPVVVDHYCPGEDLRNPLLSPVFANVAGLPPALLQVGDAEILLSDSTRFADNLQEAGIDTELQVFPEMWHVFQLFVGHMPESGAAIDKIGRYIEATFS
ncbi:MAG: alpha/beta hydrolase [Woeseiaceae bacterium]|jgi:epsilon-lactone hydrolase